MPFCHTKKSTLTCELEYGTITYNTCYPHQLHMDAWPWWYFCCHHRKSQSSQPTGLIWQCHHHCPATINITQEGLWVQSEKKYFPIFYFVLSLIYQFKTLARTIPATQADFHTNHAWHTSSVSFIIQTLHDIHERIYLPR
jgi:hypothetical protein